MSGNRGKSDEQLYQEGCVFFSAGDYGHAVVRLLGLADRGHYGAQYCMGVMYHRGLGTEPSLEDLELAKEYLLQSAGQGCQEARIYLEQYFREADDSGALSAGAGWSEAGGGQTWSAGTEQSSEGGQTAQSRTQPEQPGEDLYRQGADAYRSGQLQAAAWYFDQAARQGHVNAQFELAEMYQRGQGVDPDEGSARYWYGQAADGYRKAAERGDANAQFRLGFLYEMGEGVEEDEAQAVRWFEKAAAQGHEDAKQALRVIRSGDEEFESDQEAKDGQGTGSGRGREEEENQSYGRENRSGNPEKNREWLPMQKPQPDRTYMSDAIVELLEKESESEIIALAHKYLSAGLDLFEKEDKDYMKCIQISAQLGCPEAQDMLGLLYARGVDTEKDLHRAREWTRRAVQNGNEESRESLLQNMGPEGGMTEKEIYDKAIQLVNAGNYEEGIPYMREAAYMGCPPALNFLGLIMLQQDHPDVDTAIAYLEKGAAEEPVAQDFLGKLYFEGQLTKKDVEKCLYWSRRAAEGGQTASMVRLATMYMAGEDVKEDWGKAASLLQKAADAGDANAQRALGGMYLVGQYVKQDQKTGIYWLRKAADQGDELAREILDKF